MKYVLLTFFACLAQTGCLAQEFREKTITLSVDLTKPIEANTLPTIQWLAPSQELTGSNSTEVNIEASIVSRHAISEINVTVRNGDQQKSQTVNIDKIEYSKKVVVGVSLFEGMNQVGLSVVNNKGGKVSSSVTINVGKDALTQLMYVNRKDYALIFAIDKYDDWKDLFNPIVSAQALAKVLETDYGFATEVVKNPSIHEINRKIAEYEAKAYSNQDQLLIYFAGNCYFDRLMGFGYLVASNSNKGESSNGTYGTYLAQKDLRTTLNNFKCEHIFLAIDACCADLADTKADAASSINDWTQKIILEKMGIKTRKFLTAGSLEYTADNIPGHVSPFTTQLIESLKQNPANKTPRTSSEINSYFKDLEFYSGGFGSDNALSEFFFLPK